MRKSKPSNPFLVTGYHSPAYFCNRKAESERIINALSNGRNLTLISPRRMGKTGLIQHVFETGTSKTFFKGYYIDLYPTKTLRDLTVKLGQAVLGTLDSVPAKVLNQTLGMFKNLRPLLSFDPITGTPQIEVTLADDERPKESLDEIFDYIGGHTEQCVIAIDEFQQVLSYPEQNVEALFRSYSQQLSNVRFIFSGSQRHVMEGMFRNPARPFYQSTELMFLDRIPSNEYVKFAVEKFAKAKKVVSSELVERLYKMVSGHTWYVQYLLNRLYSLPVTSYNLQDADAMVNQVLKENEPFYEGYTKLITARQWNLMEAIAQEGEVQKPNSQEFLSKYNLGAASTVQSALVALVEKELVLEEGGVYSIYDRFLGMWLRTWGKN
jgi:uncharacterized protein